MTLKAHAVGAAATAADALAEAPLHKGNRPLSMQASVLLGHLMSSTPEIFNIPIALRLSGPLNEEAWQKAFNSVVRRHEVLRTRYFLSEGLPVMHTDDFAPIAIKRWALATSPTNEAQLRKVIAVEASRPFDLEQEWPMRVTLLGIGKDEHVLTIVLHHICCDEQSLFILRDELVSAYEAYVADRTWVGRPISTQYWECAEAQHRRILDQEMQEGIEFWRKELAGAPSALALNGKRSSQPATSEISICAGLVDAGTLERCLTLCNRYRATPFVLLAAALSAALRQHTDTDDLVIGTPISTRDSEAAERLIGFFVNTIALRVTVDLGMSFGQLVQRTRAVAFRAFSYRNVPLQKLVEEVAPVRESGDHPLFRVMLSFYQGGKEEINFAGLAATQIEVPSKSLKCDLLMTTRLEDAKISLECEFNRARVDLRNAQCLVRKFTRLLEFASLHPMEPLAEVYHELDLIDREFFDSHAAEIRSKCLGVLKSTKRAGAAR
jgi:hypothetical protein